MMGWREIVRCLIDLIFPNLCACCGETLNKGEEVLCNRCIYDIPRTNYHLQKDNPLVKRFWGRADVENATSFYHYQKGSPYRHLIHLLKYNNRQDVGEFLGKLAAVDLMESDDYCHFDYIVPVPLHPKKLKSRGYNQAECICEGMSEVLHVPVETTTLVRAIENPTQTKKSVYERWENTQGIFDVTNITTFAGKHILIVDDVLTTGSTLIACIEAVKKVPNVKVSIFTLAVA